MSTLSLASLTATLLGENGVLPVACVTVMEHGNRTMLIFGARLITNAVDFWEQVRARVREILICQLSSLNHIVCTHDWVG